MEHLLLDLLSKWPGRRATEALLEAKGFSLHRSWQQYMVDLCGPENEAVLHRYWDEYAAEYVGAAGRISPHHRTYPPQPTYRSAYLDELAAAATFAEGRYRNLAFPRCVYEYIRRMFTDRAFVDAERNKFESLKEPEIERFSISAEKITGKKRDIVPYVKEFSAARGFSQRGRTRFVKRIDPLLELEISVDTGGFPDLRAGLPLHFIIACTQDQPFIFRLSTFDLINSRLHQARKFQNGKSVCARGSRVGRSFRCAREFLLSRAVDERLIRQMIGSRGRDRQVRHVSARTQPSAIRRSCGRKRPL